MVEIVPVAQVHAAGYHACLDTVARERRYLAQVEAPPLSRIEDFVRQSVAQDAVQFFAVERGQVLGWADIFPDWPHALAHCGHLGMGVLPAHRGHGLGRRLLAACLEKAWAKGLTRIELEARVDNDHAIALYQKMGFRHEALRVHAMRFDDQYFDAVQMVLLHPGLPNHWAGAE